MRRKRTFGVAGAALVGMAAAATIAQAEVLIAGAPNAVHLEVRRSSLRQVLDALEAKFNLHYRTDDALDRSVSGTYDGPLRRVAARVLDGYDFAMTVTSEGIDVLVLRQNQHGPAVASLQQPKPARRHPMTAQEANRRERGVVQ